VPVTECLVVLQPALQEVDGVAPRLISPGTVTRTRRSSGLRATIAISSSGSTLRRPRRLVSSTDPICKPIAITGCGPSPAPRRHPPRVARLVRTRRAGGVKPRIGGPHDGPGGPGVQGGGHFEPVPHLLELGEQVRSGCFLFDDQDRFDSTSGSSRRRGPRTRPDREPRVRSTGPTACADEYLIPVAAVAVVAPDQTSIADRDGRAAPPVQRLARRARSPVDQRRTVALGALQDAGFAFPAGRSEAQSGARIRSRSRSMTLRSPRACPPRPCPVVEPVELGRSHRSACAKRSSDPQTLNHACDLPAQCE